MNPLAYPYWPAQPPAEMAPPGGPPGPSQVREDQLEALRSPDTGDYRNVGAGTIEQHVPTTAGPGLRPAGVNTRAARFPGGGPVLDHHENGYIREGAGLGAVLANTADMPQGAQLPFELGAKTWRATPTPWDEGIYAGFVEPTDSLLGDP